MYTQCPQCLTYFQVTPEHLRIAQGNVRCGQCRNVFSALGNLTEEPPQVDYETDSDELEEEIFIDEGELEDFAEEFSEEFYRIGDESGEELANEEPPQTPPAAATPINPDKTGTSSPAHPLPSATQQNSSATQARNQPLPNSQKLTEAIATIEKLKQSYSNLSLRQLEKRGLDPNAKSPQGIPNRSEALIKEQPTDSAAGSKIESQPAAPTVQPELEPPPTPPTDIAFEQYKEDDGVNYEEALSALNDLKISEEDIEAVEEIVLQTQEPSEDTENSEETENIVEIFQNDLSIDEADITGQEQPLFSVLRDEIVDDEDTQIITPKHRDANNGIKVKSLDRRASEQPVEAEPPPAKPLPQTAGQPDQASKFLPAIPKQLLEDFHPGHGQEPQGLFSTTLWSLGSILLMLAFLVQTVYFKHNDLARVPQLRPWIETFCGYMSCELSLPSDIGQLELVSQDIRSHPKVKSALLVTTTIINNASYTQSYPGLQITFSDLNGQRVAMRRFAPHEYLSADIVKETGMPPNTPIQVELEMMDPGSNAVNFEFDFIPLS